MNSQQLLQIFPYTAKTQLGIDNVVAKLNAIFEQLGDQLNRSAAFLAQTGFESTSFLRVTENLNYSANGLMVTFPNYFPSLDIANQYARQPEKIANHVYANRMGNGDEASGEGWKYKGRGAIQCTGKYDYDKCGQFLTLNLLSSPELLEQLPAVLDSAYWFWHRMNLNKFADLDDIRTITKIINGGFNGLEQRTAYYNSAKSVLSD